MQQQQQQGSSSVGRAGTARTTMGHSGFNLSGNDDFSSSGYNNNNHSHDMSYNNNNDNYNQATSRVTKYERPWDNMPHPPGTAPSTTTTSRRPVSQRYQTSKLTETAFGTAPRFKGDAPLVPLSELQKHQQHQSPRSVSSSS